MAFMLAKAIKTTKPRPRRGEATLANWHWATGNGNRLHATGGSSKKASPAASTANKVGFYSIVRLISQKEAPMGNGNGQRAQRAHVDGLHPAPTGIRLGFGVRVWAWGLGWGLRIEDCVLR